MFPDYLNESSFQQLSVPQKKQKARQVILDNIMAEDRAQITQRWANTVLHCGSNEAHTLAVNRMLLTMAAIAEGQFEVSFFGRSGELAQWIQPTDTLSIADYFSHGSRVMIDLSALSEENRREFLSYYFTHHLNARPSSHYTKREGEQLIEMKSTGHGASESVKSVFHGLGNIGGIGSLFKRLGVAGPDVTDFGIDIMMGGVGQCNLSGGISEMGMDGHLLIHSGEPQSIMIGLEQSKPSLTADDVTDAVLGVVQTAGQMFTNKPSSQSRTPSSPLSCDENNAFGLSGHHSLLGHSDGYTAAGSLYFSNPLYQLKYFEATGQLTPAKYNGMRVQLNHHNFDHVMRSYRTLLAEKDAQNRDAILHFLTSLPTNHLADQRSLDEKKTCHINVLLSTLDLKEFFKQLQAVYEQDYLCKPLFENALAELTSWQLALNESNIAALKPDFQLIPLSHSSEIPRHPAHLQRLKDTINYAIENASNAAKEALISLSTNSCDEFNQLQQLLNAYALIDADETGSHLLHLKVLDSETHKLLTQVRP